MKPILLLLVLFIPGFLLNAQKTTSLKQVISLQMPGEDGKNGASVAWDSKAKRYYAAFAGNTGFPLGVFSEKGKLLSPETLTTQVDIRGLWYNSQVNGVEMNCYNDGGWFRYINDKSGFPASIDIITSGMHQPEGQSAGCFDEKNKILYFISSEGIITGYDYPSGDRKEELELKPGKMKEGDDTGSETDDYNTTNLVYTGKKDAEFALLNYTGNSIELYSKKTGYLTKKLSLPEEAPQCSSLNFGYANGIFFLFDKENRTWLGYK